MAQRHAMKVALVGVANADAVADFFHRAVHVVTVMSKGFVRGRQRHGTLGDGVAQREARAG